MPSLAIEDRSELSQGIASTLSTEEELFSVQVSSGVSYRNAARIAGYSEDYGFALMQLPRIRTRVGELLQQPEVRVKAGINAELLMLRNRVADSELTDSERANIELRLKLLMSHAKLLGMIIERRQVQQSTASIQLDKLPPDAIRAHLTQLLGRLEPGAQVQMQKLLDGPEEVIEAEIIEPEPVAKPTKKHSTKQKCKVKT